MDGWVRVARESLGCASAATIEQDQSAERRESPIERGLRTQLPLQIEVTKTMVIDEIDRSVTDDLIRNLDVADGHISSLRTVTVHSAIMTCVQVAQPRGRHPRLARGADTAVAL